MERYMMNTDTPISSVPEIVTPEPCADCPPVIDLDGLRALSDHELNVAILAELTLIRGALMQVSEGLSEIGNVGIGGLFKGFFGG